MLIISPNTNSAFRSEELEAICHTVDEKTHRITKTIRLQFKSGQHALIHCETLKDAKKFLNSIVDVMRKDYK